MKAYLVKIVKGVNYTSWGYTEKDFRTNRGRLEIVRDIFEEKCVNKDLNTKKARVVALEAWLRDPFNAVVPVDLDLKDIVPILSGLVLRRRYLIGSTFDLHDMWFNLLAQELHGLLYAGEKN